MLNMNWLFFKAFSEIGFSATLSSVRRTFVFASLQMFKICYDCVNSLRTEIAFTLGDRVKPITMVKNRLINYQSEVELRSEHGFHDK